MNRTSIAALAFLLGGGVGTGVGWIAASSAEPSPAPRTGALAAASTPNASGSPVSPAPASARKAEVAALLSSATPLDALKSALEAPLAAPETGPTTGRITGRVVDESNLPVAGVKVVANPDTGASRASRRGSREEEPSLEESVRRVVERHRLRDAFGRQATTDAQGRFELTGLGESLGYWLSATRDGHAIRERGRGGKHRAGDEVTFVATVQLELEVTVLLADGQPAQEATVLFQQGSSSHGASWTASEPVVRSKPGTYQVVASSQDGTSKSQPVAVTLTAGQTAAPITLRLEEQPGIRGIVSVPPGETPEWVMVRAIAVPDRYQADKERDKARLLSSEHQAHTQPGEEYAITGLKPGRYLVGVGRSYQEVAVTQVTDVGQGMARVDLALPSIEASRMIVVRATGPSGQPVGDLEAHVTVSGAEGWDLRSASTQPVRRADGSLCFAFDDDGVWKIFAGEQRGKVTLAATSATYGSIETQLTGPEVQLRFSEPAKVVATVQGYAASDLVGELGFQLLPKKSPDEAYRYMGRHGGQEGQGMDKDGQQVFTAVQPGEYRLALIVRQAQGQQLVAAVEELRVTAGEVRRTFALPALHKLTVRLPSGTAANGYVQLQPRGRSRSSSGWFGAVGTPDAEGRTVFQRVPAGEYMLMAGMEMMSIAVRGPTEVEFQPSPITALEVTVTDPEGAMAKAGFKDGDLIVGMAGKEFENLMQMQMALMGSMSSGKEAALMVDRSGSRLELKLALGGMQRGPQALGGDMQPATR